MLQEFLSRFVKAQEADYKIALSEIKNGRKQSHWMWYIFPQVYGLGLSETSSHYGVISLAAAEEYLKHPVLGTRLVEISNELLKLDTDDAYRILGSPDDLKLKSSMTLFSLAPNADPVFQLVLDKFFRGDQDDKTVELLNKK